MAGRAPEERIPLTMIHQSWCDVTFLHWRFDPAVLDAVLPDFLAPDVADGSAWVSLTPFHVEGLRPPGLPALPGVSGFPETNLRTYVRGPGGADGLWFFTLEVGSALTTVGGQCVFGVPYRWADMHVERAGPRLLYTSRRRGQPEVGHHIAVEPGPPFAPGQLGPLDHWLTGRWRGWTRIAWTPADIPVRHQPWPLHRAEVVTLEETLFADAGLPAPAEAPLVHFSPGVDAHFGPPRFHPRPRGPGGGGP